MRGSTVVVPALVVAALLAGTPAAAQPRAGSVFISAGAVAVIDEGPKVDGLFMSADDRRTTVAGGALGLGVHLTPRVSVRAEVHLSGDVTSGSDLPSILGGGPPFAFRERFESTRKTTPLFALIGYHLPAGRLSVEVTGGLGLVRQSVTSRYETSISAPGLPGMVMPGPTARELKNTGYHAVAVVGADFAVAATTHLAVVPQVRAYVLGSALSLRPGLGLRWTF